MSDGQSRMCLLGWKDERPQLGRAGAMRRAEREVAVRDQDPASRRELGKT